MTDLETVREFWESSPLWTGESGFEPGTREFFDEHRRVYIADCFAGRFDKRFLPPAEAERVLDLGCGIGFWTAEFALRGVRGLHAADLTERAVALTRARLALVGGEVETSTQNAEAMDFADASFDHVNCQGVIHHTPDTEQAVREIARVLKPGGTASISVYYRNPLVRAWPYIRWVGIPLAKLGGGLKGRGRESIFLERDVDEIVRLFDGADNPIGRAYTKRAYLDMLGSHFEIVETFQHFFPARALPFRIPAWLHRWLDAHLGFMVFANVRKPCAG